MDTQHDHTDTPAATTLGSHAPQSSVLAGDSVTAPFTAKAALFAGVATILATGVAIAGSQLNVWDWQRGVAIAQYAALAGLLVLAVIAALIASRRRAGKPVYWARFLAGAAAALVAVAYGGTWALANVSHPALHDLSTSLASPPEFAAQTVRVDNLDQIPGAGDSDMAGLNPRQRWAAIHQEAYPELRSVRVEERPAAVIERMQRIAEDRNWTLVGADPVLGQMEFRGTTTLMNVPFTGVARAQAVAGAQASVIDVRMIAATGRSDRGTLAPEMSAFLSDVSGTTTATRR